MFSLLEVLRGYSNSFNLYNVAELSWNRIGRSGVQADKEDETFAVVCSRFPQNLKFSHFTCQGQRRNVPKFITPVQALFCSLNPFFMTFPLPSLSYLLKFPFLFRHGGLKSMTYLHTGWMI